MQTFILKYLKMIPIITLLFLVSCGSRQALPKPITITETKEVKQIVRDTIVWVEKDSTQSIVQIDCSDKEKPKIKTISDTKGRNFKPPQLTLNGDKLTIDCKAEAEQMALKLYDKYVRETKPKIIYLEKPFKWYHKALMWLGGMSLLLILLVIFLKLYKK